ncbi:recombinase RecA [Aliivibrio fischeri]|uniref:DUF2190 family protein n=1 Tax=Aliivibrio fischeri TaxID=668 RepID=UPI00080DF251|nr:capsid cement protein [Aliivibrio fischeri]OCH31831.1 recombinase RecA [Aliivibrio fischeri]
MAKNFVQDGDTITFVAAAAVSSGEAVVIGDMVAVSINDVSSGEEGVGHTTGVWSLPKASATTIEQGTTVYLKDGEVSTDTTGTYAGKAWEAGINGHLEIAVKLNATHVSVAAAVA